MEHDEHCEQTRLLSAIRLAKGLTDDEWELLAGSSLIGTCWCGNRLNDQSFVLKVEDFHAGIRMVRDFLVEYRQRMEAIRLGSEEVERSSTGRVIRVDFLKRRRVDDRSVLHVDDPLDSEA